MSKEIRIPNQLLSRIADGDWDAFAQFYQLFYTLVFRFTYYFLKDKEGTKEVVADVFLSVWQSRKKITGINNMEIYLYVSARNEANRYLRQRSRHYHVSFEEIPIVLEETEVSTPEDVLITQDMQNLLTCVINNLPDKCRQIFLLSRQEGLKSKEIADALSINESTVRVQLKIATGKIVESLKKHYPELFFLAFFFFSN